MTPAAISPTRLPSVGSAVKDVCDSGENDFRMFMHLTMRHHVDPTPESPDSYGSAWIRHDRTYRVARSQKTHLLVAAQDR